MFMPTLPSPVKPSFQLVSQSHKNTELIKLSVGMVLSKEDYVQSNPCKKKMDPSKCTTNWKCAMQKWHFMCDT